MPGIPNRYTGSERHTTLVLKKMSIDLMEAQPGGIRGYVAAQGDNAEWPVLCAIEDETSLIAVRDGAHTGDLGAGDFGAKLDFITIATADSKFVVEAIKNHHAPHGCFREAPCP